MESRYNPNHTLRAAMIEKIIWPRTRQYKKNQKESSEKEFSKKDLEIIKEIDLDTIERIVDKYGRKGSNYSEKRLGQYRLFSKKAARSVRTTRTKKTSRSRKIKRSRLNK